jgi:hypothetical protein
MVFQHGWYPNYLLLAAMAASACQFSGAASSSRVTPVLLR